LIQSKTLARILLGLPVGIFLAEVIAMILVYFIRGAYWYTILIDAVVTTALTMPLVYALSYRPLLRNLAEREQTKSIMQFRLQLIQSSTSLSMGELLQSTLDEIEALTGCQMGFFHFLEPDQQTVSLQAWSTNTLRSMCSNESEGGHDDVQQAGIWADCIRRREPVIHNDYAHVEERKGVPDWHAQIMRDLTVPILRGGLVVAVVGVGNKPTDFSQEDIGLVSSLADFAWDVIESKRAGDALRESQQRFRTLVEWTYTWESWVDPAGKFVYLSPSCERISGYRPDEFIADPELSSRIIHPDDRAFYAEHHGLVHDQTAGISNIQYRILARDGSERWIDHFCRPLFGEDNRYLGRRISNRDITKQRQGEIELAERNNIENMLTQTIHTLQLRMARDLHDTIGQNIAYLRMKLAYLSENSLPNPEALDPEIRAMLRVASESYELIRGTLDVLQSEGVFNPEPLFVQYASRIEDRASFKINIASQGEFRPLNPSQVRQIFFVFREALNNIEQHADARDVTVDLLWNPDRLTLRIVDDGKGFKLDDTRRGGHYGLKFMQERVESMQGSFTLHSMPGEGTSLTIEIPFQVDPRAIDRHLDELTADVD